MGHVWSVLENTGRISVNWSNCSNSFKLQSLHVNVSSVVTCLIFVENYIAVYSRSKQLCWST